MVSMDRDGWRAALFDLTNKMEEPLREAEQFVHVLGLIDPTLSEDHEAVAAVAQSAAVRLETVTEAWRGLNALRREPDGEG